MLLIKPADYDDREHAFWFPAKFPEPLILAVLELRSERIYDLDHEAQATALSAILDAARHLKGQPYTVFAQADTGRVNKLRSYKGVMSSRSSLRHMEHSQFEVQIASNLSRLGAVVRLQGARFDDEAARFVLNYWEALFLVSKSGLDEVQAMALSWMTGAEPSLSGVNFGAVSVELAQRANDFAMRYFPADNGRHETIALLFNESKIEMAQAFFRSLQFRFKIK